MKKIMLYISILLKCVLILSSIFLLFQIFQSHLLPLWITGLIGTVITLVDALILYVFYAFRKSVVIKCILILICIVISVVSCLGGFYLMKTTNMVKTITTTSKTSKQTVSVIVKSDSTYQTITDLQDKLLATNLNPTSTITQCIQDIQSQSITITTQQIEGMSALVSALYNQSVDAIIIQESSRDSILELDGFSNFDNETRVIYQKTYDKEDTNQATAVETIQQDAFNILITGSDSRNSLEENSRSDVNMIVTVNPSTSTILLTSIPRDYYVTTKCDEGDGCQIGALDKLTHTGIHGVNTTKKTIENLLGIQINYTFKVGFNSIIDIVDALGGIDVNVAQGYVVSAFHTNTNYGVVEGMNHLNGEAALAYSRERYAYLEGDRQRVKNQQQVFQAVIEKLTSPSAITNFSSLMDAFSHTFITNMSSEEIQNLIQYQIQNMPTWYFEQYSLDGTGSTQYCAELGQQAYVMIPDEATITEATTKIQQTLTN